MDFVKTALELLPNGLRPTEELCRGCRPEEIRLRMGQAPTFLSGGDEFPFCFNAVSRQDIARVLEKATGASLHSAVGELREGYVSYRGLRIGVCGTAVVKDGAVCGFKDFSSLNIRIPRNFSGDMSAAFSALTYGGYSNTLVLAPPGGGKTTALRELIRCLSEKGERVGVVDERGELTAVCGREPCFDLGRRSDVLLGIRKSEGAIMLLRSMNPTIIAVDEITERADISAMLEISGCGVGLLATAHAASAAALRLRGLYRALLDERIFKYALEIDGKGAARSFALRKIDI